MKRMPIGSAKLAYRVYGDGPINIVIEPALNASSAEWWHIAERLSKQYQLAVLVYDRAGYGKSSASKLERTPKNIAAELGELLDKLDTADKLILIGHSQGGLYAQQFARLFPERIRALVLLDPLSAHDNRFQELLSKEEYEGSGVNKLTSLRLAETITRWRLGFLFKRMLKLAPPFHYYKNFDKKGESYILKGLTRVDQNRASVQEYTLSHDPKTIAPLQSRKGFPPVPLYVITHTSDIAIDEIMRYGGLSLEQARNVENVWQSLMKEYLNLTDDSRHIQASKSGHYIHLTEPECLDKAMEYLLF
jgi:pimeloyl-ACP methyl ester carboxylesterase